MKNRQAVDWLRERPGNPKAIVEGQVTTIKPSYVPGTHGLMNVTIRSWRPIKGFDFIEMVVSQAMLDKSGITTYSKVVAYGEVNTHYRGNFLYVSILVDGIGKVEREEPTNMVIATGRVYKMTPLREASYGACICNMSLEIRNSFNNILQLPCILWRTQALISADLPIGTEVTVTGRLQSRRAGPQNYNLLFQMETPWELSVSSIIKDTI